MNLVRVTAGGEQHGLVNEMGNSVPFDDFKHMTETVREKARKMKKEDNRIVKATYINLKSNTKRLDKQYCRWAGDPIQQYHLIPGETYEVPMGFVNEVNDTGIRIRGEKEVNGEVTKRDGGLEQEYKMVSAAF